MARRTGPLAAAIENSRSSAPRCCLARASGSRGLSAASSPDVSRPPSPLLAGEANTDVGAPGPASHKLAVRRLDLSGVGPSPAPAAVSDDSSLQQPHSASAVESVSSSSVAESVGKSHPRPSLSPPPSLGLLALTHTPRSRRRDPLPLAEEEVYELTEWEEEDFDEAELRTEVQADRLRFTSPRWYMRQILLLLRLAVQLTHAMGWGWQWMKMLARLVLFSIALAPAWSQIHTKQDCAQRAWPSFLAGRLTLTLLHLLASVAAGCCWVAHIFARRTSSAACVMASTRATISTCICRIVFRH